jgi:hypothetical protein
MFEIELTKLEETNELFIMAVLISKDVAWIFIVEEKS